MVRIVVADQNHIGGPFLHRQNGYTAKLDARWLRSVDSKSAGVRIRFSGVGHIRNPLRRHDWRPQILQGRQNSRSGLQSLLVRKDSTGQLVCLGYHINKLEPRFAAEMKLPNSGPDRQRVNRSENRQQAEDQA